MISSNNKKDSDSLLLQNAHYYYKGAFAEIWYVLLSHQFV